MAESMYDLQFKVAKKSTQLCKPLELMESDLQLLRNAVEENYYFEFVIDDLPLRNFIGYLEEEGIFPHTHKIYFYTHHHFVLEYNKDGYIITAKVQVTKAPPVRLDEVVAPLRLSFTYSVEWIESRVSYKDRESALHEGFFPKSLEIHWLSVINSTLLVFLLMGFVILILFRIIRNDLTRYNEASLSDSDKEDQLDNGWKVIHTDVFRFPKWTNLFCAILGVGSQLLAIGIIILLTVAFGLINVHRHGLINSSAVVLYALTSGIAGFVSARMYKRLNGNRWIMNINMTSTLFSVPAFLVWFIQNSFFWGYQSTQALPFTTILLLFAVWLCTLQQLVWAVLVGYPMLIVGGIIGKNNAAKFEAPCRTRNIPREIPPLPWYQSCVAFSFVGGFLSFSAISVELYYVFATIWGHEPYTLYGILLIVFIILLSVTACVSIALTYFQLSAEDYRSTGLFVFAYSLFFYFKRSQLNGLLQTIQYFGYVSIIVYAFCLSLGTVSFFASQRFISFIYSSIKTD